MATPRLLEKRPGSLFRLENFKTLRQRTVKKFTAWLKRKDFPTMIENHAREIIFPHFVHRNLVWFGFIRAGRKRNPLFLAGMAGGRRSAGQSCCRSGPESGRVFVGGHT